MIYVGDCIESMRKMEAGSVHTCVTSPPYFGLRDYGHDGQIGLEETPAQFVAKLVEVFAEVHRVLRDDGTLWLNLGDSYARNPAKGGSGPSGKNRDWYGDSYGAAQGAPIPDGLKEKDLIGIPWRVAFALQDFGWYLRQEIIWHKPNPMPESVTDRCTKAHEHIFLLSKSPRYYFDHEAIKEPAVWGQSGRASHFDRSGNAVAAHVLPRQSAAQHRPRPSVKRGGFNGKTNALPGREAFRAVVDMRNKRSVWTVPTRAFKGAHFATFPEQLIEPCILAGAPAGGVVLDPFMGAGTTAVVAERLGRKWLGCELNPEYAAIAMNRIRGTQGSLLPGVK